MRKTGSPIPSPPLHPAAGAPAGLDGNCSNTPAAGVGLTAKFVALLRPVSPLPHPQGGPRVAAGERRWEHRAERQRGRGGVKGEEGKEGKPETSQRSRSLLVLALSKNHTAALLGLLFSLSLLPTAETLYQAVVYLSHTIHTQKKEKVHCEGGWEREVMVKPDLCCNFPKFLRHIQTERSLLVNFNEVIDFFGNTTSAAQANETHPSKHSCSDFGEKPPTPNWKKRK